MGSGTWVALSGALARLRELDAVAHNLANADTVGFKRERVAFTAALASAVADVGAGPARGAAGRVFPALVPGGLDLASGPIAHTGAPLDVAIDGEGFFEIETAAGPRYTRAGAFSLAPDGTLVTMAGDPVRGEGGPITAPEGDARILPNGEVVDREGQSLGRLAIVRFADPSALVAEAGNLLRVEGGVAPEPVDDPRLVPGALERSNVRSVEELANLVLLQRAFDITIRAMQSDDDATRRLIQEMS